MEWKTSKQLKKELNRYVLETADELIVELKEKRKSGKIKNNEKVLCTS